MNNAIMLLIFCFNLLIINTISYSAELPEKEKLYKMGPSELRRTLRKVSINYKMKTGPAKTDRRNAIVMTAHYLLKRYNKLSKLSPAAKKRHLDSFEELIYQSDNINRKKMDRKSRDFLYSLGSEGIKYVLSNFSTKHIVTTGTKPNQMYVERNSIYTTAHYILRNKKKLDKLSPKERAKHLQEYENFSKVMYDIHGAQFDPNFYYGLSKREKDYINSNIDTRIDIGKEMSSNQKKMVLTIYTGGFIESDRKRFDSLTPKERRLLVKKFQDSWKKYVSKVYHKYSWNDLSDYFKKIYDSVKDPNIYKKMMKKFKELEKASKSGILSHDECLIKQRIAKGAAKRLPKKCPNNPKLPRTIRSYSLLASKKERCENYGLIYDTKKKRCAEYKKYKFKIIPTYGDERRDGGSYSYKITDRRGKNYNEITVEIKFNIRKKNRDYNKLKKESIKKVNKYAEELILRMVSPGAFAGPMGRKATFVKKSALGKYVKSKRKKSMTTYDGAFIIIEKVYIISVEELQEEMKKRGRRPKIPYVTGSVTFDCKNKAQYISTL